MYLDADGQLVLQAVFECTGELFTFGAAQRAAEEAEVVGDPHNLYWACSSGKCDHLDTHTGQSISLGDRVVQLILYNTD